MSLESQGIDYDKTTVLSTKTEEFLEEIENLDGLGCFLVSSDSKKITEGVKKQTYGTLNTPLD